MVTVTYDLLSHPSLLQPLEGSPPPVYHSFPCSPIPPPTIAITTVFPSFYCMYARSYVGPCSPPCSPLLCRPPVDFMSHAVALQWQDLNGHRVLPRVRSEAVGPRIPQRQREGGRTGAGAQAVFCPLNPQPLIIGWPAYGSDRQIGRLADWHIGLGFTM